MENNSMKKNLSEIEIYSIVVMTDNFSIKSNHVTLDRGKALVMAYDAYYKSRGCKPCYNVFIDTWRDDVIIKVEYIDSNGNIEVNYEKYNVWEKLSWCRSKILVAYEQKLIYFMRKFWIDVGGRRD